MTRLTTALIDAAASLALTDRSSNSPLALARGRRYTAMVEMLYKAGS